MRKDSKSGSDDRVDPILRIKQILPILKIGRTTFYKLRDKKPSVIPEPFSITPGGRAKFWRQSSVITLLDELERTGRKPK